jgi:hypothetical protein
VLKSCLKSNTRESVAETSILILRMFAQRIQSKAGIRDRDKRNLAKV